MLIGRQVEYSFIQGKGEVVIKTGVVLDKILMTQPKDKTSTDNSVTGYIIQDTETSKLLHIVYWRIVGIKQ